MSAPALSTHGLSMSFGSLVVARDIELSLPAGARYALIGPNGAGKTTLINLMTGMLTPKAGRIFLGDEDVTALEPQTRVRRGLARTFQINNLFPNLSVLDNIVLAVQAHERSKFSFLKPMSSYRSIYTRSETLMADWDLTDKSDDLVRNLSYGDQRVLEIVMALAQRPRLLLLDEPTGGLSPDETATVTTMLKQLPEDITVLLIEHDMDVAFAMADRVTVFYVGQVLVEGTPDEVRNNARVQEIYLGAPV